MASSLTTFTDEARIALDTLSGRATGLFSPSLRLGVTGLSRAGKTVFISAFVHNLIHGGRLPLFEAQKSGRIARAFLEQQPDDAVPRFQYEDHIAALVNDRVWPDSTRAISELRLTIEYESASGWNRMFSSGKLSVDIVDYPGEWLLDLPLLGKSFADFSREALEMATLPVREDLSRAWRAISTEIDPNADADEMTARRLAESFAAYLKACKLDERALSTLPPGRFLMPGDLEGSPALTFAPLAGLGDRRARNGSLHAMMERRYEAYKTHVVKPFFREHITRLDRQIVLIDAMQALNAGPGAMADLERAVTEILNCFRPGRGSFLTDLFSRRIDRILVAATKADHLHHESHDRLQAIVRRLADRAVARANFTGADVDVVAMAAVRATREGTVKQGRETLPVIIGTPIAGEKINGETFDGKTETAIFPGDLPEKIDAVFDLSGPDHRQDSTDPAIRFVRFRPPKLERTAEGVTLSLPHIRLDRALQFLIGDHLA
ncbi:MULTISPECIES: YcjX family protein [unclassified Mesorhizobium]|uniref:YcjX family protein n=3 Tax=Mesorhizobium TaxID=68287 RepID=UPI0010925683|nr:MULTISPECIES: YcjX family protein [unclassified Mesorhizobium]TGP93755.1 YcjX family protein [Mesorhizobium sp. M8A.F.Ca.ET.218.01.1.1]TGS47762.1 YcjX family protein [Mesorhizobium sp. M8A.F.Ca.ET.182.01.1.1]TGS83949.1 YcjX family protein [Mesorhizobium sp. M8A.F.Ca.ET.181.01.1.1]TGT18052.1 YcjX family protein [Mesorhizobium sp. M8A.F.Ca.ET.213.01.1.1]TIT30630.1 MAG: YcjX family protein [Mesorhizobium sp.]